MAIIKIKNQAIDLDAAEIPNLPATKITSGTFDNARISLDAAEIPNLDTAKITTGTLADARVPDLNASKITAGTIATARLGSGTASSSTFLRGDNTFNAPPLGGITEAGMFRLSANVSDDANPISANLERVDDATFAKIGSGMSLSSGIFTFPSTGLYLIQFKPMFFFDGGADSNVNGLIQGTPDNSTYDTLATSECGGDQGYNKKKEGLAEAFFNCTNVSTHKIRFKTESMASNSLLGVTDYNKTFFVFIRLGDSQ